jgi:hypothetical protein
MIEPLTRNKVDIKAILADPLLRDELIEGATDFICKVEGIRRKGDLKMTDLSPQAQAVLDAYINAPCGKSRSVWVAAALRAAADQIIEEVSPVETILAIAAELEAGNY